MGLYIGDGYIKTQIRKNTISREERQKYRDTQGKYTSTNTIVDKQNTYKVFTSRIEFAIPKDDKARNLICHVLSKAGIDYDFNDAIVWFSSYGLSKKLSSDCGHYFDKKFIPDWIYQYDREFLENLLSGLLYSDGDAKRQYFTSNESLAMSVIRLIFTLGYYPSLIMDNELRSVWFEKEKRYINKTKPSYCIGIGFSGKNKVYKKHIQNKKYHGKVWCLEVKDNHNFMIIRNGKIAFSGNSTSEMFGKNYSKRNAWHNEAQYLELLRKGQQHLEIKFQNEDTPFAPQSPYGVSKVAAHNSVSMYRRAYNIFGCCGILFNHESERRGEQFVTRKITKWLAQYHHWITNHGAWEKPSLEHTDDFIIVNNDKFPKLRLGNLDASRDWGHAEDYVKAMWLMLQQSKPDDYVICSGETHTVAEFLSYAFKEIGIEDYSPFTVQDPAFMRPAEVEYLRGENNRAKLRLMWSPEVTFEQLVSRMVRSDIERIKNVN